MSFKDCVPQWLNSIKETNNLYVEKIRQKGRSNLNLLDHPNTKNENWRLSNIKRLENFINLPFPDQAKFDYQNKYPIFKNIPKNILQIKIDSLDNPLESLVLPEGVRALNNEEIECYLGHTIDRCNSNNLWPVAINEASTNQVIGLEVKGNNLPTIELVLAANANTFHSTRVLIKVREKTTLNLNEVIIGSSKSSQSNLMEIIVGEEANVHHGIIALGGGNAHLLTNLAVEQKEQSNYSLIALQKGWLFSRFEPHIIQLRGNAKTNLKGLQISTGDDELSTHSYVRFDGPNGELDQLNKAAANDNSHSIFNGAIQVPKVAQKTQAAQLSRNLILSKRAKIDTKPELEIIADDVRCTHGATISQLQEEELFYLRSRGINSKQAYSLLLEGYYKEIISMLPLYSERWSFLNNLL